MASIHITTPPTSAWVIPTNQTLNVPEKGAVQFKRTYKIPTRNLKNILNGIKSGMTLGAAEGWIRGVAGTLDDAGLDSIFAPPANVDSWVVLSYYVNQITAGEYMEVQITYGWTDLDINGIFSASAWTQEEVVSQSVQWQTYSVSPYIYCNEKKHTDSKVNRAGQATVKPEDALKSKQKHINGALTNPPSQSDNDVYKWVDTSG